MTTMRRLPRILAGTVVTAALVAGCSSGGTDATSAESAAGDSGALQREAPADAVPQSAYEATGGSARGESESAGTAHRTTVQTRAVIRTGRIAVVVKDLETARGDIDGIVARHGGYIAEEEASADRRGRLDHARLVLRLPVSDFGSAMTDLAELGRRVDAHTESEDVTTEVIDVDTRVAVQRASIDRLQRFLRRATTVEDMIRVEEELSRRQAQLESLLGQQAYLADRSALSTITVSLSTVAPKPEPEPEQDDSGFLAGLKNGWAALTTVLVGLATVAGALLPFAVAFAVVGVPLWLLTRTVVARRSVQPTGPAAPPQE